jgi:hypothetical protein
MIERAMVNKIDSMQHVAVETGRKRRAVMMSDDELGKNAPHGTQ